MQNKDTSFEQLQSLLNNLQTNQVEPQRFWLKESGCLKPVKLEDIDWIEAMDDYVCLHVGKTKPCVIWNPN